MSEQLQSEQMPQMLTVGKSVLEILLCDDDAVFLQRLRGAIREQLNALGQQAAIRTFQYAEDIPKEALSACDIAFLDIDFKDRSYTGIDIARQLRKLRKDTVLLFVSNYPEYAPEGYELQAFRYLLKSELAKKLPGYLSQALSQLTQVRQALRLRLEGTTREIPLEQILYVETQQHILTVRGLDGQPLCSFYGTLRSMEALLETHGFLRPHKCFLVNAQHIRDYQHRQVQLRGGICLPSSRQAYAEQKRKYLLWKGRV